MNKTILDESSILSLKHNKHLITMELLDALREHGNEGKKIALEILDLNTTLIKEGSLLKVSSDKIELKSDSFDYLWWVPFTDKSDILDTLINGDCARVVNIHNIIGRRTRLLVKETVCPTPPLSSNTDSKDSELEQFLKSTMENIHQFKEDVKDYIEDIEKTARDLEEYEKELERSSDKNGEDTL